MRRLYIFFSVSLIIFFNCNVSASYIRSVTFSKEPIEYGENFDIIVDVRQRSGGESINIYIDNNPFSVQEAYWSEDRFIIPVVGEWGIKIRLDCGAHTIKAEVVSSGLVGDSFIRDFNVGNTPEITFDPVKPKPENEIEICFRDSNNDVLSDVEVSISYTGDAGEPSVYDTNSDGCFVYTPTKPGKYKLEITKAEYCTKTYFYAKREMIVEGPKPENPMVGDVITLAVPSGDIGVEVYNSKGDLYLSPRTLITGLISFTINKTGEYKLIIGEHSTRYWGIEKKITVSKRQLTTTTAIEPQTTQGVATTTEPTTIESTTTITTVSTTTTIITTTEPSTTTTTTIIETATTTIPQKEEDSPHVTFLLIVVIALLILALFAVIGILMGVLLSRNKDKYRPRLGA